MLSSSLPSLGHYLRIFRWYFHLRNDAYHRPWFNLLQQNGWFRAIWPLSPPDTLVVARCKASEKVIIDSIRSHRPVVVEFFSLSIKYVVSTFGGARMARCLVYASFYVDLKFSALAPKESCANSFYLKNHGKRKSQGKVIKTRKSPQTCLHRPMEDNDCNTISTLARPKKQGKMKWKQCAAGKQQVSQHNPESKVQSFRDNTQMDFPIAFAAGLRVSFSIGIMRTALFAATKHRMKRLSRCRSRACSPLLSNVEICTARARICHAIIASRGKCKQIHWMDLHDANDTKCMLIRCAHRLCRRQYFG